MEKIFVSIDKKHNILIMENNNEYIFNIEIFNFENYKSFLLLLKEVITYLNEKNVKFIIQYINKTDYEYFSESIILEKNNDIYKISSPIESFVLNIYNALGLKII